MFLADTFVMIVYPCEDRVCGSVDIWGSIPVSGHVSRSHPAVTVLWGLAHGCLVSPDIQGLMKLV